MSHSSKRFWLFTAVFSLAVLMSIAAFAQNKNKNWKNERQGVGNSADGATLGNTSTNPADFGAPDDDSDTPPPPTLSWQDQYARELMQNAETYRRYDKRGEANPDSPPGFTYWEGGPGDACTDGNGVRAYALVCENDASVYCTSTELPIDGAKANKHDLTNPLASCRYADTDYDPQTGQCPDGTICRPGRNEIEPAAWSHDPRKCGFANGLLRVPCKYTHIRFENTVEGVERDQRSFRATAIQYCSYPYTFGHTHCDPSNPLVPESTDPLNMTVSHGNSEGEWYRQHHTGWPAKNPDGSPGKLPCEANNSCNPTPAAPAAPVVQTKTPDTCMSTNWNDTSPCDGQSGWNSCKDEVATAQLNECHNQCDLKKCSQAFEAVAQNFPPSMFGTPTDKAAFFRDSDIVARARTMESAISAFESSVKGGQSMYGANPDQCFYAVIRNTTQDWANPPSSCLIKRDTPDLSQLSQDLETIASGGTFDNGDFENRLYKEIQPLFQLANSRVTRADANRGNSASVNYFSKNSGLSAAQIGDDTHPAPLMNLIKAAQNLIYDVRPNPQDSQHPFIDASFADLVAKDKSGQPNPYRKYLVAGDEEFTASNVAQEMVNVNKLVSCFTPPANPADSYKDTFQEPAY